MTEKSTNLVIASLSLIAAALMLVALSFAIGKWSFGSNHHTIKVLFPSVAGIEANSEVRLAGAPAGHVVSISLLPKAERQMNPLSKKYDYVQVIAELNDGVEIGNDFTSSVKQDGLGISPKYLLFVPGSHPDAPPLPDGGIVQGEEPFDITDLAQQAGSTLNKASVLLDRLDNSVAALDKLQKLDNLDKLDKLSDLVDNKLPPLLDKTKEVLNDAASALGPLTSDEGHDRLNRIIANLNVVTTDLKVVTANSKALTTTLAEKPWRLIWGGKTVTPVPESQILESDHAIPLKGSVNVQAAAPTPSPKPRHTPAPAPAISEPTQQN